GAAIWLDALQKLRDEPLLAGRVPKKRLPALGARRQANFGVVADDLHKRRGGQLLQAPRQFRARDREEIVAAHAAGAVDDVGDFLPLPRDTKEARPAAGSRGKSASAR